MKKCILLDCESESSSRGLCNRHYLILLRGGGFKDVKDFARYGEEPHEKMLKGFEIDEESGCWNWVRTLNRGRGQIKHLGKNLVAYRVSYEHFIGDIPSGLALDHLCENIRCINPFHLEPVTTSENTKRYHANRRFDPYYQKIRQTRKYCKNGHSWAGENLVVHSGRIVCRLCNNKSSRINYSKNKAYCNSISHMLQ